MGKAQYPISFRENTSPDDAILGVKGMPDVCFRPPEVFYLDLFRRRTALIATSTVVILSFTQPSWLCSGC